jgi:LIM domain kinase 1
MRTVEAGWNPLDLFFSSGLLMAKCDICVKRIGWKPVLECDDCGLRLVFGLCDFEICILNLSCRTHIKCGEVAPMDCGIQPIRPNTVHIASPLLKLKQNIKSASSSPGR